MFDTLHIFVRTIASACAKKIGECCVPKGIALYINKLSPLLRMLGMVCVEDILLGGEKLILDISLLLSILSL
ncbi:MAG: hypothetical protein EZS28_047068 [Streblomastix strix]|uniref:Uncharacterized protein n=1 Tax=Streblomastix strix TaxID=222440 RepID=A0A5J4TFX5_9EUKA|nr:MAG: hypothetical protein EZS28_047068 [Streblomastix strix]